MFRHTVTVREFARLTTGPLDASLDRASVSASAFDWLCGVASAFDRSGAALVQVENRRWLRLDNYVGVIETPCGTQLEILPKHTDDGTDVADARALLKRMIGVALDLPVREAGTANLQRVDAPLSEWVLGEFLRALSKLVKQGVQCDYIREESSQTFLRGQVDVSRHLRQPAGRQHVVHVRYDVFSPDRAENRLLRRALDQASVLAQTQANWRLARELRALLHGIPSSSNLSEDFRRWRVDRLTARYAAVRPWCELVLNRQMPHSLLGEWRGISLLFPMEKLFERYVSASLRRSLVDGATLKSQAATEFLCRHDGARMFRLQPDLLVEHGGRRWILDTKWKRLDGRDRQNNYGLSQADFYQLLAYGNKYSPGGGDLALIFPRCDRFTAPLPVFDFGVGGLRLHVLPFDLERQSIDGLEALALPFRPSSVARTSLELV